MTPLDAIGGDSPLLERMWEDIDWTRAENHLASLQRKLSEASAGFDKLRVRKIQDEIVGDLDCRCLAVHKVAKPDSGPGIDNVRWTTGAQKMAAALSLGPRDYHAQPQKLVKLKPKHGRERYAKMSTYFDRAMATLYSFALTPVTEASAEKKSFAFRKGRSAHDALKYVTDLFKGADAPEVVLIVDVKAYYDSISHGWLLSHVPMDRDVLREFLGAGVVYAHALFPAGDHGISLGNPLSPVLGNFVLDGMQRAVRKSLSGPGPVADFRNGEMVRFADDAILALRSFDDARRAKAAIEGFCAERGLALNEDKTVVCTSHQPFDFLSYTFQHQGDKVTCRPSDAAVERFACEIKCEVSGWNKSLRKLIEHLNSKLKGWAGYFRYGNSREAFRDIDYAVDAALLEAMTAKYPKERVRDLTEKFWYRTPDGSRYFTHPTDRTQCVCRISDTPIAEHRKVRAHANPFLDAEYFAQRQEERDIANVSGPWRAVWDRQGGRCFRCGTPILVDQGKLVVARNNASKVTPRNGAYIHEMCAFDEVVTIMLDTSADMGHYDVVAALTPIAARARGEWRPLPAEWRYAPLLEYFSRLDKPRVVLTFAQIEEIIGGPLPVHALRDRSWWKHKPGKTHPPRAWIDGGYELEDVDVKRKRAKFVRAVADGVPLSLPPALVGRRVPDNVAFEHEQFCLDLIQRYGL